MYARPIIYKIYSIINLVGGVLGFLGSIASMVIIALLDLPALTLFGALNTEFLVAKIIIIVALGICGIISLLFTYAEFSSMHAFADMIKYEEKGIKEPMKRGMLILPGKFYSKFGSIIFGINATVTVVAIILLVIIESVTHSTFIAIPIIPIGISLIPCVIYYINYYLRYNAVGNLLEVVTSADVNENQKQGIKDIKTGLLRGYCSFLFILCGIIAIAVIIMMFFVFEPISALIGIPFTIVAFIAEIISTAISFIFVGIYGCYMDNIAKMVEHYQIKFGMFKKEI